MIDLERTKDVELLREVARVQDAEIRRQHEVIRNLTAALASSEGAGSEGVKARLALLTEQLEKAYSASGAGGGSERRPRDKDETSEKKRQSGQGPRDQASLDTEVVEHELDDADKTCPGCGGDLKE